MALCKGDSCDKLIYEIAIFHSINRETCDKLIYEIAIFQSINGETCDFVVLSFDCRKHVLPRRVSGAVKRVLVAVIHTVILLANHSNTNIAFLFHSHTFSRQFCVVVKARIGVTDNAEDSWSEGCGFDSGYHRTMDWCTSNGSEVEKVFGSRIRVGDKPSWPIVRVQSCGVWRLYTVTI